MVAKYKSYRVLKGKRIYVTVSSMSYPPVPRSLEVFKGVLIKYVCDRSIVCKFSTYSLMSCLSALHTLVDADSPHEISVGSGLLTRREFAEKIPRGMIRKPAR